MQEGNNKEKRKIDPALEAECCTLRKRFEQETVDAWGAALRRSKSLDESSVADLLTSTAYIEDLNAFFQR
jgi:hypothetical protein